MFSQGRLFLRAAASNVSQLTAVASRSEVQTLTQRLEGSVTTLSVIQLRYFNSVKFNSKVEFFSVDENIRLPKKVTELKEALEGHTRPLTLLPTWLMAKDKHISKYVNFYHNLGIDVCNIKFAPIDIVSPRIHGQRVVDQFLRFLHNYPENCPFLIHGFSVGGYLWAASMIEMEKDFERHGHLKDRFIGQIWDSVVDVGGLPIGVARSVTDCVPLQNYIQRALEWYLKVRYDSATVYYNRASVIFHKNYVGTPGLFFVSKIDPVSPPSMVYGAHDAWKNLGFQVYDKCFDDTNHVAHRLKHQKEYDELVLTFLKSIGLTLPVVAPTVLRREEQPRVQKEKKKKIQQRAPAPAPVLTLSR